MADLDRRTVGPDHRAQDSEPADAAHHRIAELHARALAHIGNGRLLEAQSRIKQAFKLDGDNAETLHLMAVIGVAGGQFDHAMEWASRALRKSPQPAYLVTLGRSLLGLGRIDDALKAFDKAVQLKPDDAELWRQMGDALIQARRLREALLCFEQTLKLDPRNADASYKTGHILFGEGKFEEALAYLSQSADLQPDHAATLHMRALVFNQLGKHGEAIADGKRGAELDPRNAETLANLGGFLQAQGRLDEALSWYDRSLKLRPDAGNTVFNRALTLADLGRLDEAMSAYKRAATRGPKQAQAAWNLALLQMLTGDFARGWKGREARWDIPSVVKGYPPLTGPRLAGLDGVAGKTILVCADEGLGDAIHFVRYVPMLAAKGANIVLVVQDALCPLFAGIEGVSQCLPGSSGAQIPPFDFHCPLGSLPLLFGTRLETIPAAPSYLPAVTAERVQTWDDRLGPRDRLRIGLVWSGNRQHLNDHNRSIPFRMIADILDADASFVSLQKDVRPADHAALLERTDIRDVAAHLTDFSETAALISCLDLVISVDTSVAHLAAALGKPTWILLPHTPDYRWLLGRDDNPWYPTVRLFRQSGSREYGNVIGRVREALTDWLGERQPR